MNPPTRSIIGDLANVARGVLMGGADVIPGVSGGTVALILGIYERVVTAISRFDGELLSHLRARRWMAAVAHVDLRFLLALGIGIGGGIVGLGLAIHHLWQTAATREPTLAVFMGMILASVWVVVRMVQSDRSANRSQEELQAGSLHYVRLLPFALVGVVVALIVTLWPAAADPGEPSLIYVFVCGAIGICAMILPGISGAYLLLILGVYIYLTDILHTAADGEIGGGEVLTVAVFAAGCGIGLISFSKLLRWLLARYHAQTMAVLVGFMLGAVWKVWPFQRDLTPHIEKVKKKDFQPFLPDEINTHVVITITAGIAAFAAVLIAQRIAQGTKRQSEYVESEQPGL